MSGLKPHDPMYTVVKTYTLNFRSQLESIKSQMRDWTRMDLWDRLLKKDTMLKSIIEHHRHIGEMWRAFQTALQMQGLAATVKVSDAQTTVVERVDLWRRELAEAQQADKYQYREFLNNTTRTINKMATVHAQQEVQFENLGETVRELADLVQQFRLVCPQVVDQLIL
ncbi:uncharacterized protein EI90DRAFT_844280 [Cantharellus anzutake]|uniref:uncharacterized protein n=1 Tax=Cantharellus anzutake TaxID=1750568 RepID=UPI0019088318|nr:uncharacterized protein EI90DRAFT_844280 [Cantharellus anzutake]KAF8332277.1 hypothetical protein EI90DRAFT_844280 [Cantharellus anzutake]